MAAQTGTVEKSGQRIVDRVVAEAELQLLVLGHVFDLTEELGRRATGVPHERHVQACPDRTPVGVLVALLEAERVDLAPQQARGLVQLVRELLAAGEVLEPHADELVLRNSDDLRERRR